MIMNADDFFGGAPSISFRPQDMRGRKVGGIIVEDPELSQQTDYNTNEPLFWDKECTRPKMQMIVKLRTDIRDPQNPVDDGVRRLFIKGDLQRAVGQAIRESGVSGLRTGGALYVAWVDEAPAQNSKHNNRKIYAAQYRPPEVSVPTNGSDEDAAEGAVPAGSGAPDNPFA